MVYTHSALVLVASEARNLDVVKFLVENGADLSQSDECGVTALHTAARIGFFEMVVYLVENGASIDALSIEGHTPLSFACYSGSLSVVKYLMERIQSSYASSSRKRPRGVLEDGNPSSALNFPSFLCNASKRGNLDVVKYLVETASSEPFNLDIIRLINFFDESGKSPLGEASRYGNVNVIKYLVELGADVNQDYDTPLHLLSVSSDLTLS